MTQYTVRPLRDPANAPRPQQANGFVSGSAPSLVQNLISLFEKPFSAPIKCSESFSSSDSAYESGTITADTAMSSHSGRNGLRSISDGNDTSELTPSTVVKTSPDKESTTHDKSSSIIPLQTLHITRNTALEQVLTVLSPTKNITLHRKNSHLAFLASIHAKPTLSHKFYWTPSSTHEIETFNLGHFQSSALCPCYFHQGADTGCYGSKSTVTQLGSLPKFRPFKGDDDKVLTEFDEPGFCACCYRCTGSARLRQRDKIHQIPYPAPRSPPRPLTPNPRPVQPPPRPARPRPSPIPRPDAPPASNFSFGDDTVYHSMSNSDSDSDAVLSDVFEFFRHVETVNVFPAKSATPGMSKEQVQQITAKAQRLDAAIKSLLVQLDDFVVQGQDSDDFNLETESGSLEQIVDDHDIIDRPGAPRKPPLRPIPGEPFPAPPPLPPPRGNSPPPQPPRCAVMGQSTMGGEVISDTLTVTDVNSDQGTRQFRMSILSRKPQKWARGEEDISVFSKARIDGGSIANSPEMDPARLLNERSFMSWHDQNRRLCQAIVSQLLQMH